MMNTFYNTKAIAIVTTALFFASLLWTMNTHRLNSSLETGLENQRLKSEELLSEKLLLEKDLKKIKNQLFTLQGKNLELDNVVKNTSSRLEKQETEYARMKKENLSLAQIKKQRKELIALQSKLQNEHQTVRSAYEELEARNNALMNSVAFLEERNMLLTNDLNKAMVTSVDQSQIHAVKRKNEMLTVRAKRTKKLIANFEAPTNLKNLTFRIVDPTGNTLTQKDGTIASTSTPSENNYIASSSPEARSIKLQKVEMTFIPKTKLKTGVYMVEILNENLYVGSLKVKLK